MNAADWFGETPLTGAIEKNNLDAVKVLIQRGANVNFRGHILGAPLILAVSQTEVNLEIVKALIDAGAYVTVERYGSSALKKARRRGRQNKELIDLLSEAAAVETLKIKKSWRMRLWKAKHSFITFLCWCL